MWRWLRQATDSVTAFHGEATGLRLVSRSHEAVASARVRLAAARKRAAEARTAGASARSEVEEARSRVDAINRVDPRFPALVQKEHEALKASVRSEQSIAESEELERIEFENLSAALERSHGQEREYAERTKWYSLTASVVGGLLGLVASTVIARSRQEHLTEAAIRHSEVMLGRVEQGMERIQREVQSLGDREAYSPMEGRPPPVADDDEAEGDGTAQTDADADDDLLQLVEAIEARIRELKVISVGTALVLTLSVLYRLWKD